MLKTLLITIFVFVTLNMSLFAQVRNNVDDENNNTVKLYNNIENFSKKRKITKFIHELIFKKNVKSININNNNNDFYFVNKNFESAQNKIIRKINITTLDPFGFSESDTIKVPSNVTENIGNRLHLKSKRNTIKNLLIFKENQQLDSLKLKESERLIRTQRYVRSVLIKPVILPNNPDSVDVSVRVLDSWSLYADGSISKSDGMLKLTERNFGGFGHEFSNQFRMNFINYKHSFTSRYHAPNIQNTYISTTFLYDKDLEDNYTKSWKTERPLYSSYTRLAGGAHVYQRFYRDTIPDILGNKKQQEFKFTTQDYWFAYSTPLFENRENKETNINLITSIRYLQQKYNKRPTYEYDTLGIYSDQKTALLSIGLSSINYKQDKYIFNHDIIEDIRVGEVLSTTIGVQNYFNKKRYYIGTQLSFGGYTDYGYISTNIEWGSYISNKKYEQSVLWIEALHFSNLFEIGRWKFRNFIRPQLVIGYNRVPHISDKLRIDTSEGIEGFKAPQLRGNIRGILSLQLQSYAPTNWMGFRFNPFLNTEFGFLSDKYDKIFDDKIYTKLGIGVVINNDYLVFNNIQITFAYYPIMPEKNSGILKINSIKNNNIDLRFFNYDGKPSTVPYR